MNHPPDRDRSLANFLRDNAPEPPPADPALRSQILAEIEQQLLEDDNPQVEARSRPLGRKTLWWLLPPAVAAAALASWLWPRPVSLTVANRAELEEYLVSSWISTTTITTDPLDDWLEEGEPDDFDLL
ncbi:MAG: hypothetical protein AB4040_19995 [Synechococcus sp.]